MKKWLYEYLFNDYPPIYISSWGILFLLITIVIVCFIIFISRIRKTRHNRIFTEYTRKYEDLLTSYVFDEEEFEIGTPSYIQLVTTLKKELKKTIRRSAFIKLVLALQNDLKGDPAKRLIQLYKDIELDTYAILALKHGSWYQKAFEFTELGEMQIERSLPIVLNYIDHYNTILREEAQFAAVKMGGVENLIFLKTINKPVSVWQQTRLMQELDQFPLNTIPSFYYLLEARNETVILFGLKLISHYRQMENPEAIVLLLTHHSNKQRLAALETLIAIDHYPAVETIVSSFYEQKEENWPQFLSGIGYLGDKDHIPFLLEMLGHEKYEVVMEATKALIRLGFRLPANTNLSLYNKEIYKHARYELIP